MPRARIFWGATEWRLHWGRYCFQHYWTKLCIFDVYVFAFLCFVIFVLPMHFVELSHASHSLFFKSTHKLQVRRGTSSLPQVGCVRGANTFPNHNQSLPAISDRTSTSGFLVALNELLGGDSNERIQSKRNIREKSPTDAARGFSDVRQV